MKAGWRWPFYAIELDACERVVELRSRDRARGRGVSDLLTN
jgi:hypothetical protein